MTARWSDPHRLPGPSTGYVRAVNPSAAFDLNLAPDQIGAILSITAVIHGLITRSRVSPV
jgi:hypothetical protein